MNWIKQLFHKNEGTGDIKDLREKVRDETPGGQELQRRLDKQLKKVNTNFFNFRRHQEYLNAIASTFKDGREGIFFFPVCYRTLSAEKILIDLFRSNNNDYKLYASALAGYIENPEKALLMWMYEKEKAYYINLTENSSERYNSHAIVENLVISALLRVLIRHVNGKGMAYLEREWLDLLHLIVKDSMNGLAWNSAHWAIAALVVWYPEDEEFEKLRITYEDFNKRTGMETTLPGYKETVGNIEQNILLPKVADTKIQPDPDSQQLIDELVKFMKPM